MKLEPSLPSPRGLSMSNYYKRSTQIKGLQTEERAKAQDIPPPSCTTRAQTAEMSNPRDLGNWDKDVKSNTHTFGYHHSWTHTHTLQCLSFSNWLQLCGCKMTENTAVVTSFYLNEWRMVNGAQSKTHVLCFKGLLCVCSWLLCWRHVGRHIKSWRMSAAEVFPELDLNGYIMYSLSHTEKFSQGEEK